MDSLIQLPTWLSLLAFIALQAGGLFAVYGLFDSKYRERQKEKEAQEDRIIDLYKTELEALKQKLQSYDIDLKSMRTELSKMAGENKLMKELLTGKDKDSLRWRNRTEEAMDLIQEIGKLVVANGKKTELAVQMQSKTSDNIERLAKSIEKHLEQVEKK